MMELDRVIRVDEEQVSCSWLSKTVEPSKAWGHHRLLKDSFERRITKVVQSNRRVPMLQIERNLNPGATTNIYERSVHHALHRTGCGCR
ncbi:hypothetical protein TNCV_4881781 [Trichonephila clavipes]|nr:hypothetical protein TNCV_4881781 [Trichonephila clavipes]